MFNRYPIGPASTRVFAGFKLAGMDRDKFYAALGNTFMPGTPYMQAPMGLNAYLPAVLDIDEFASELTEDHAEALPDEVALIVYANIDIYQTARKLSLRRRMYTHSHRAVFNMDATGGGGQFPVSPGRDSPRDDRLSWNFFDHLVDWQTGVTQLLFVIPEKIGTGIPETLGRHLETRKETLATSGVDQAILLATPNYAVIWTHSNVEIDLNKLNLLDGGYTSIKRSLSAQTVVMRRLEEDMAEGDTIEGIQITEASMYTFQFQRDTRFHDLSCAGFVEDARAFTLAADRLVEHDSNNVGVEISELEDGEYRVQLKWAGHVESHSVEAASRSTLYINDNDQFSPYVAVKPADDQFWGTATSNEQLNSWVTVNWP